MISMSVILLMLAVIFFFVGFALAFYRPDIARQLSIVPLPIYNAWELDDDDDVWPEDDDDLIEDDDYEDDFDDE